MIYYSKTNNELFSYCTNGDLIKVQYLVSIGADIHADNDIAIGYAAIYGYLDIVQYLISVGADNDYALR